MTRWMKWVVIIAFVALQTGCRCRGERQGLFRGGLFNRDRNQPVEMGTVVGSPGTLGSNCCDGNLFGTTTSGPILTMPGGTLPSPNSIPPAGIQEKNANPKEYDPKMSNSGLNKTLTEAKASRPY